MRTPVWFLIAAVAAGYGAAPAAAQRPDFTWSGALRAGQIITIRGINGSIKARPAANGTASVSAEKSAHRSNPAEVKIVAVPSAEGITVCALYPGLTSVFQGLYPWVTGQEFALVSQQGPFVDLLLKLGLPIWTPNLFKAAVGGVKCDHLLFSRPGVDFQIWVTEGKQPWPRKYVVTEMDTPARLSITTIFSNWNMRPAVDDSQFRFVPPKGTNAISFMPPRPSVGTGH